MIYFRYPHTNQDCILFFLILTFIDENSPLHFCKQQSSFAGQQQNRYGRKIRLIGDGIRQS